MLRPYERIRDGAGGPQHGLAVLQDKGLLVFLKVAGALVPAWTRPLPEPVEPLTATGVEPEIIRVWSRMVLAHAP
ncbi:hypothetical protein OV450_8025 [Actinobacteria bacterium OV450]|nr:hypothetical protein OV450_8025 [Actinobacteria bacterium OV450]